jgi:hypothetical protein
MDVFWEKYYPWIRKGLYLSIFIYIILHNLTNINFSKSLILIMIITFAFLEMAHLYLNTDLD